MELQPGDAIEYKGKPGKVTKVTDQKVGIQLDDPDDKDQPKGLVNKTSCVKLEKTSVPEGAVTPSRNRSARAGGGAAIGMAIGAMVAGVVGASVGAGVVGAGVGKTGTPLHSSDPHQHLFSLSHPLLYQSWLSLQYVEASGVLVNTHFRLLPLSGSPEPHLV